ncbi:MULTISPECIES: hypothetical protein [unclassified Nocardia]|uniref:hypothetical protein n=1 Tax=unclassified Nocardia TaxID=2637762 RepID=UPI00278BEBAE|nr:MULTISPECIES: hypothetical protein [unclassified Nocardia]
MAADKYVGLAWLAYYKGVPVEDLTGWRRTGEVWVPTPDVSIGHEDPRQPRSPGWSRECVDRWTPGMARFTRPEVVVLASTQMMCDFYGVSVAQLWSQITNGQGLLAPHAYVDDIPGWLWVDGKPGHDARQYEGEVSRR